MISVHVWFDTRSWISTTFVCYSLYGRIERVLRCMIIIMDLNLRKTYTRGTGIHYDHGRRLVSYI